MLRAIRIFLFWITCAVVAGFFLGAILGLIGMGFIAGLRLVGV